MSLPTDIEKRIGTWVLINDRLKNLKENNSRPTITISRQYGCQGYRLAEIIKTKFEQETQEIWNIYDRALLDKVAKDKSLSAALLEKIGDESRGLSFLSTFFPNWPVHEELFQIVAAAIIKLAISGNAIIIGRGGACLCAKMANCFHFRLEAPPSHRILYIRESLGISEAEAQEKMRIYEKSRIKFIEDFFNTSISDSKHYHTIFNSNKIPLENIANQIVFTVNELWFKKRLVSYRQVQLTP